MRLQLKTMNTIIEVGQVVVGVLWEKEYLLGFCFAGKSAYGFGVGFDSKFDGRVLFGCMY